MQTGSWKHCLNPWGPLSIAPDFPTFTSQCLAFEVWVLSLVILTAVATEPVWFSNSYRG